MQLTGPVVRFCEHGVVFDRRAKECTSGYSGMVIRHLLCYGQEVLWDGDLAKLLGVYAVFTTPEHAAAWRRELGVSDV